ncbi:hypothetical protein RDWZM_008611 [Blomia tropicalis]|uniref:Protein kinase domain-containing protein n=1 Tax=Blomia tropicalis TaxID=40697 RepID=A0A9Q0M1Q0_BLOTA|nr:hypothetical protein BLOT_004290 [Blomia tropicalis]KAJ6217454.1 hypothetical protein RDWZM_008611 [Blomia tropicalis]
MDIFMSRGYIGFEKLDAGGQANVYKTSKNGQDYAIKVVHVEDPKNPKLDDDLKRELQIVRNLRHPNCIYVEELFRTRNKIYIVMHFMPNGNIGNVVRRNGPLCEWNAKLWYCPIARAIKYLHEHKIAHRDLKLDNVLLDAHLNPILTDFGFSRFVQFGPDEQVVVSDTYCGTTSYNPPEILKETPYNPFPGDVWCLGIMLFIMLNQIYPFDRHDKVKMYNDQMTRNYKLQETVETRSSAQVKDLIDLQLEPDPSKRPTIQSLCKHCWFPIILNESELISNTSQLQ